MKKRYPFFLMASLCLLFTITSSTNVVFGQMGDCNDQVLFASSNTSGMIGTFDVSDNSMITNNLFAGAATDADGIYYDSSTDKLYQINRSNNTVDEYSDVLANLNNGMTPSVSASSTPNDFSNGREIAVFGNKIVVAQDANTANGDQNKLIVFTIGSGTITLDKVFDVSFNLWGIHTNGNMLLAVEDNSNNVAVFDNFFNNAAGAITPTMVVAVDGLVRTHGLTYDNDEDYLILTDIGDAGNANDGALVAISNFTSAMADGTISSSEQVRVSGGASKLGNPVDVAYNPNDNRIYVAERANTGGLILGFKKPVLSGGIAPAFQMEFAGASAVNFSCASGSAPCDFVDGGTVELSTGGTETTIFVDGTPDELTFNSSVVASSNYTFTYVVTDSDGMILGIPPGNMVDFDGAGLGVCNVYGLTYTGMLNIAMGDDLFASGLAISDGCFDLSSNSIAVTRVAPQTPVLNVFASSNTSGQIGVVGVLPDGNAIMNMFDSQNTDADGISYNEETDRLYQLNRTDNVINVYGDVSDALANGTMPTLLATSTSDFSNGREIAVAGNKLVVAQDAATSNNSTNSLVIYDIDSNSITLDKIYNVNFNLWGIHLDGSTLYAIQDNSPNVSVFQDFFNNAAGAVDPTQTVFVQNMVRTHGLTYNSDEDLMILTDIGDAGNANDGFLVVIPKFTIAASDNTIELTEQRRVGGGSSQLGNPVDVAFDDVDRIIYVAERAKNGGMILGFKMPALSGGIAPMFTKLFAGASAVNISGDQGGLCDLISGGTVAFENGGTETTIFIDGNADELSFTSTVPTSSNYTFTYVVTDSDGMILGIPPGNTVDFDGAGFGVCNVYGLTYTGMLNIAMGDDLFAPGLMISDDCFDLSSNNLAVNRIAPQATIADIFASSNTSGTIGVLGIIDETNATMNMFGAQGADADGIHYDDATDMLYQLNRSANVIDVYADVKANLATNTTPTYVTSSTSDFSNGREMVILGTDKLVVAQDASTANGDQNKLVVYDISGGGITLSASYDVNINLWGIENVGDDLFAIVDNSNQLAIFEDLLSNTNGNAITPDQTISVDGLVRTHGLTYNATNDYLILTDIGAASSAGDGALVAIRNFSVASADDNISMSEQVRVSGGTSQLGNPVDVEYDSNTGLVYVAERANGGGKILAFRMPVASGGIAPVYVKASAGVSAIYLNNPTADSFTDPNNNTNFNASIQNVNIVLAELYPIPASTRLNAVLEVNEDVNSTINIYSLNGSLVKSINADLVEGKNTVEIDISNLQAGTFFFNIPELGKTIQFVKL